jgi:hypothetical protein
VFIWVGRIEEVDEVLGKKLKNEWDDYHETTKGGFALDPLTRCSRSWWNMHQIESMRAG